MIKENSANRLVLAREIRASRTRHQQGYGTRGLERQLHDYNQFFTCRGIEHELLIHWKRLRKKGLIGPQEPFRIVEIGAGRQKALEEIAAFLEGNGVPLEVVPTNTAFVPAGTRFKQRVVHLSNIPAGLRGRFHAAISIGVLMHNPDHVKNVEAIRSLLNEHGHAWVNVSKEPEKDRLTEFPIIKPITGIDLEDWKKNGYRAHITRKKAWDAQQRKRTELRFSIDYPKKAKPMPFTLLSSMKVGSPALYYASTYERKG